MKNCIVSYDCSFNYFGDAKYKGKPVTGIGAMVEYELLKDGKHIYWEIPEGQNEPEEKLFRVGNREYYITTIFPHEVDKEQGIKPVMTELQMEFVGQGYVVKQTYKDFFITYYAGTLKDTLEAAGRDIDCPENISYILDLPASEPEDISKEEFLQFIKEHFDELDIPDNHPGQSTCWNWREVEKDEFRESA